MIDRPAGSFTIDPITGELIPEDETTKKRYPYMVKNESKKLGGSRKEVKENA